MLPMVVAPTQGKLLLCPHDLIADVEASGLNPPSDFGGVTSGMPAVGAIPGEKFIGFAPTRAVVIRYRSGLALQPEPGTVANAARADWSEAYKLFPGDVAYV